MSSFKRETRHKATCEYRNLNLNLEQCVSATRTCVTRNLVIRSGSLLFSLDRIISSMSPCSFSITTNTRSGVSNMHSKLTMPGWCRFWGRTQNTLSLHWFKNSEREQFGHRKKHVLRLKGLQSRTDGFTLRRFHWCLLVITCNMATSFLSWLSCLVGNLILSITLMATSLPLFLCLPKRLRDKWITLNNPH